MLAFAARQGASSGHTAIAARTLNIVSLARAGIGLEDTVRAFLAANL